VFATVPEDSKHMRPGFLRSEKLAHRVNYFIIHSELTGSIHKSEEAIPAINIATG
jgi:hypothetical protein